MINITDVTTKDCEGDMNVFQRVWKALRNVPTIESTIGGVLGSPESLKEFQDKINIAEVNIEVPETMIQQAAAAHGGDEGPNHFAHLLMAANMYREANLTPIYLTNQSQSALRVIAREYIETPFMVN